MESHAWPLVIGWSPEGLSPLTRTLDDCPAFSQQRETRGRVRSAGHLDGEATITQSCLVAVRR